MSKRKIALLAIVSIIVLSALAVHNTIPEKELATPKATFIISGWDYPDAYDQGIEAIEVEENSSGSWSSIDTVFYDDSEATCTFDIDIGAAVRLTVFTFFNSTLTGVGSRTEGKNYQRHYVIMTDSSDNTVFSQQNFTYVYSDEDNYPLYYYGYRVTLDYLLTAGEVYTVEIMYEIYY